MYGAVLSGNLIFLPRPSLSCQDVYIELIATILQDANYTHILISFLMLYANIFLTSSK